VAVVQLLREQLKSASEQISTLMRERDQLLESGNRMRAEMKRLRAMDDKKEGKGDFRCGLSK